jgi:PAS domain S-box-containing protein
MPDRSQGSAAPNSEELFELIVDSSTDFAIFTTDLEGIVTSWNVGAARLFGYPENEIIGSSGDVIFTPEDRDAGAHEKERLQARSNGRALDERWHQRKDGSRFWASGLLMRLRRAEAGFVKITRDRTEQHRAEQLLQANEERFRLLATSIPQLVFRTLPDGTRTWGSPQWIDFTGLSLDESLGFGWLDAIHPEDRAATQSAWRDAQQTGEYYIEHRVRRVVDGEYRWHQTRARPLEPATIAASDWVGTMTDIHDLRGMHDRQQVLMAELQHRTRNLLAVVQSIATQTIRSSASLQEFKAEFESRLRALGRVQSLLARADDRAVELKRLVTAELAAHGEGGIETGKIELAGPPVALPAMAAQALGLALHELATNAVKYGALSHPTGKLSVSWQIGTEGGTPHVALHWAESGVPMPENGAPARRGYGTELIERALPYQLRAKTKLDFGPDGVRCAIQVPVSAQELGMSNG